MKVPRLLLSHLALGLAGWGIARSVQLLPGPASARVLAASESLPTKTARPRPAAAEGKQLLGRLMPGLLEREVGVWDPRPENSLNEEVQLRAKEVRFIAPETAPNLDAIRDQAVSDRLKKAVEDDGRPHPVLEFRKGRKDAKQVHDEFAARFPEDAAVPEFRRCLYLRLAWMDPVRAQVLLEPLAPAERTGLKQALIKSESLALKPATFLALMNTETPPVTLDEFETRRGFWSEASPKFASVYGVEYRLWVEQLPAGLDRDMALSELANLIHAKDSAQAERLEGLIQDRELLDRR